MLLLGVWLWSHFLQLAKVEMETLEDFHHMDKEEEDETLWWASIYASVQASHLSVCITVRLFIRLIRSTEPTNCLLFFFHSFVFLSSADLRLPNDNTSLPLHRTSATTLLSDHVSSCVCEKTEERDKTSSLLAFSSPICHLLLSLTLTLFSLFFSTCLFLLA